MRKKSSFYDNKVVIKPWGYEYVIYNNASRLAITFLKIKPGHKTSLHCHPKKKTGFIILSGKAQVQILKENFGDMKKKCNKLLGIVVLGLFLN